MEHQSNKSNSTGTIGTNGQVELTSTQPGTIEDILYNGQVDIECSPTQYGAIRII